MARINLEELKKTLEGVEKELEGFLATYDKTIGRIKKDSEAIKNNVESLNTGSAKGIIDLNKALEKAEKLAKEREKTTTQKIKTEQELQKVLIQKKKVIQENNKAILAGEKIAEQRRKNTLAQTKAEEAGIKTQKAKLSLTTQEGKEVERLRLIEVKKAKETEKEVITAEKLNSVYAKESKRLIRLRKDFKDLTLSEGKSTKATRKLKREIDKLDKSLKLSQAVLLVVILVIIIIGCLTYFFEKKRNSILERFGIFFVFESGRRFYPTQNIKK